MAALVVGLLGLVCVVVGLSLWSVPLALLATGAGLIRLAVMLDRPTEAPE